MTIKFPSWVLDWKYEKHYHLISRQWKAGSELLRKGIVGNIQAQGILSSVGIVIEKIYKFQLYIFRR